ncbi:hypothetical protein ACFY00_30710 [Kitasatospora sp. NPDC001540]|uniref:hypothetical protein n=1 Tax=Kitasatospora sp. NPDC001540 TaxID=3364014 RepID=UPI00369EE229
MTDTRARVLTAVLDVADNLAITAAAAAAGLTTYRVLHGRPTETRAALALAAAALAAVTTDQITTQLRRPLRDRLGLTPAPYHLTEPAPAPTTEQLASEAATDAAHRAATQAHSLDHSGGSLTKTDHWTGHPDGTATCDLDDDAHLLCIPSPAGANGYTTRTFLLMRDGGQPVPVRSISEIVALLDLDTEDLPAAEDGDPWTAIGEEFGIEELLPADAGPDEDNDRDQEAEAYADGSL